MKAFRVQRSAVSLQLKKRLAMGVTFIAALLVFCAACQVDIGPQTGSGSSKETPEIETSEETAYDCELTELLFVGEVPVWEIRGERGLLFIAGLAIDVDGAPNAYHPQDLGLAHIDNAGKPGNWWALVTDNGRPDGNPVLQEQSDPFPGYYISTTALFDPGFAPTDPRRYVDSRTIAYFVLPLGMAVGAELGDFGVVMNTRNERLSAAIFADLGPRDHIGEGSIALAENLGLYSGPRRGGTSQGIAYLVFRGSGDGRPKSSEEMHSRTLEIFEAWGGKGRLRGCLP